MRLPGILLTCLLLSGLSAAAQHTDSLFMRSVIRKLENAKEYTLKVARLMPADQYSFRPTPEEMTFAEQLTHLAANLGWLSASYLSKNDNPVSKADSRLQEKEAVLKVLERTYDFALGVLKNFNPEDLGDKVDFFAGPMSKLQIIHLVNDHQTHHRGQLLVYLRLNGIRPPAYVGW